MSNIKPILNLNKHPKDCDNLSLVNAVGVQLSNDVSVLENEKSIEVNKFYRDIKEKLDSEVNIVGAIPCNTEIIFFVIKATRSTPIFKNGVQCYIFRCNEELTQTKLIYDKYLYYGGEITGTFTYNSRNELILAVSEYDGETDVPLKSFNIGTFDNDNPEDLKLSFDNLSIIPSVKIPQLENFKYINGKATKGWYNFFIRFKINKNDYTQWYPIGYSIFLGSLDTVNMFKVYGYSGTSDKFVTGFTDNISDKNNYSNETVSFNLTNLLAYTPEYNFYQLAYVCSTTSSTLVRRTEDISTDINSYAVTQENFTKEETLNDVTNSYYNYYDVKSLINYQNRLYIANYKEKEDIANIDEIVSKIRLSCYCSYNRRKDIIFNLWNSNSQLFSENRNSIVLTEILKTNSNTQVTIKSTGNNTGFYSQLMYSTNQTITIKIPYKIGGTFTFNTMHHEEGTFESDNASIRINGQTFHNFHESINIKYINDQGINRVSKIDYLATATIDNVEYRLRLECNDRNGICTVTESNIEDLINQIDNVTVNSDNIILKNENGDTALINAETGVEYKSGNFEIQIDGFRITSIDLSGYKTSNFIDTNKSFQDRKLNDTLIPGEIYNFYIHFVDKYGEATRGYRIDNNFDFKMGYDSYVPIGIMETNTVSVIALIPIGNNIFTNGKVNIPDGIMYMNTLSSIERADNGYIPIGTLFNERDKYNELLKNKVADLNTSLDIKWEDLPDGFGQVYYLNNTDKTYLTYLNLIRNIPFIKYQNSNEDNLFKVPDLPILCNNLDTKENYTNNEDEYEIAFPNIKLRIEDITLPEGYIGYFISYEKQEKTIKNTGVLTNADFINYNMDEDSDNGFINHNKATSENIYFYSNKFDIDNQIDVNYSFMDINKSILFEDRSKHITVPELNANFKYYNLNNPVLGLKSISKATRINNYTVCAGGDANKNRNGLGTALQMDNQYSLFSSSEYNFFYTRLISINRNIYTSTNKTLIRLTNIIYDTIDRTINHGYNGYQTYDGICCYNSNKIIFNSGTTKIVNEIFKNYDNKYPLAAYFQFPLIDDVLNETKSFNNESQHLSMLVESIEDLSKKDEIGEFSVGNYISPENSIDTYNNNFIKRDDFIPKYYENYNKDLEYLYHFTKYVRRSNIIQDESLINAWRQFPVEGYKIITENKGIITNLIGIGTILLVHCEHSLFMFDRDNTLKIVNQSVQLQMPDIFDVDYKEVFTSDLGFGGLQDRLACIVDQFGYIFYDNSNNRLYRFDAGKLNYLDIDIINFLQQYKPNVIRFANDSLRNRLLINVEFTINSIKYQETLSYNYLVNNFVSRHIYTFDKAYSTKSKLYLIHTYTNVLSVKNKIVSFKENNNYGKIDYELIAESKIENIQLDFIINDTYNAIKYLEYITYKLYLLNMSNIENYIKHINERKQPYSGLKLRIYNDLVDTGEIDILIDNNDAKNIFCNFTKPYWDLGNWNFSYLRDIKNGQTLADYMSRLYGNYFIVSFILNNKEEQNKIEFEDLNYVISKDKK